MADWYFRRKGAGTTGTNAGTSEANAWQGAKKLADEIAAGTVNNGDTVHFVSAEGPLDLTDRAEFPAGPAASSSFSTGSMATTTTGGILFGSAYRSTSTLVGVTIDFHGSEALLSADMTGITTTANRQVAAVRVLGEDITIRNFYAVCGDWNYIRDPNTGVTRIAGTSSSTNAEDRSQENIGLAIWGNGNTIDTAWVDGNNGFCRQCIYMGVIENGVSNASDDKTNTISNVECFGANQGISIQPYGVGGWDLNPGQKLVVHDILIHTACWGRDSGMTVAGYNAAVHGNGFSMVGKYYGGAELYDFEISGEYQDGLVLAGGTSLVGRDGYIHDIGAATHRFWQWNTTTSLWQLTAAATNLEGNGVKAGLNSYDGTSPSTWLGLDGTLVSSSSASIEVPEVRTILLRLKIYRCRGIGITTNDSRGTLIHACEIDDTGNACIELDANTRNGNYWISNCFLRKVDSEPSNNALSVRPNVRLCGFFNNILWSNSSVSSQRDVSWNTALSIPTGMKDKNLLVTGRTTGTVAYPTTGDLATQTPAWTQGSGLSAGSALRRAGAALSQLAKSRTTGHSYGIGGRFSDPPNLGPYA